MPATNQQIQTTSTTKAKAINLLKTGQFLGSLIILLNNYYHLSTPSKEQQSFDFDACWRTVKTVYEALLEGDEFASATRSYFKELNRDPVTFHKQIRDAAKQPEDWELQGYLESRIRIEELRLQECFIDAYANEEADNFVAPIAYKLALIEELVSSIANDNYMNVEIMDSLETSTVAYATKLLGSLELLKKYPPANKWLTERLALIVVA